jgi:hypothetical protein
MSGGKRQGERLFLFSVSLKKEKDKSYISQAGKGCLRPRFTQF